MDKTRSDLNQFYSKYNATILEIHQATLDAQSNLNSEKSTQGPLTKGLNLLTEIDKLIAQCIPLLSTEPSINDDFMQLLVSNKPRLENEINLLNDAIKNPHSIEYNIFHDDELDQQIDGVEAEILEQIKLEKEKQNQLQKMHENAGNLTQHEIEKTASKLKEEIELTDIIPEANNSDWMQEDELQKFFDAKRKGLFSDEKNDSIFDFLHDDSDDNQQSSDDEQMTFEKQQEVAKNLMANFLGLEAEEEEIHDDHGNTDETQND